MDYSPNHWEGKPSHIVNLNIYIICLLTSFLIFPIFYAIWKAIVINCTVYELDEGRLRLSEGVLNREIYDIELYSVKNYKTSRPLLLMIFGLSNIHLDTSNRNKPQITLHAVPYAEDICMILRDNIQSSRMKRQEIDIFNLNKPS